MGALGQLVKSVKASLAEPDPAKAMDNATKCFVRQRVRAGCPETEAKKEVQEHVVKFVGMVEKAYDMGGAPAVRSRKDKDPV